MRFDFTLTSTFLFASAVLADLSREHRSPQLLEVAEKRTSATSDSVEFAVNNPTGAFWEMPTPTFQNVTATIVAPYIWNGNLNGTGIDTDTDTGVAILVGLDGSPSKPCAAGFSAGLKCTITSSGRFYTAGAYWSPNGWIDLTNIEVSYGDTITVAVSMTSQTSGNATFANKYITETLQFNFQSPLCQLSAGWFVGKLPDRNLSHFGFAPFSTPEAYGQDGEKFTGGGSSVYDIVKSDGSPLTKVEAFGDIIRVIENLE